MTGIPEYGTGRHEDYLTRQDEERAAISAPAREFTAWADARCIERGDLYGWATMADAFAAGMQAQRNLDAMQEVPLCACAHTAARHIAEGCMEPECNCTLPFRDAGEPEPARRWTEKLGPVVACEHDHAAVQWTEAEFAAVLDSFYAWFTVTGGGARVQGQLLGADADEFARALHAGLESARAHREKGSPA